jgi:hypothetical protein
MEKLGLMKYI